MDWWRESRFGMFIHFGIYAAAEGMWKGEPVQGLAEWMQCKRQIPIQEYQTLAEHVTLERFNAEAYAELARKAGMKYVVFTAKHHDGFAMYDSKYSSYNVVSMCPSHRDPARELADAVRSAGLKMCFYYSQALDWEDPDAFGNTWDFKEDEKNYRRFLDGKCKQQLKELLTEYGEVSILWFDMPRGMTKEESLELKAYVKQFQPNCIVSGRINMDQSIGDYGSMGDNEFPSGKLEGDWETPATLNNTWGYRKLDTNWKTAEELIRLLVELLSKGMNYLLNIGPMADGTIPEESVRILEEMGRWVSVNQEAVYGTEATPFRFDFPWGRISRKGSALYLYLFEHRMHLEIPGIHNKVLRIALLEEGGEREVTFCRTEDESGLLLSMDIPPSSNPYYDVIRVELDGMPEVKQGIFPLQDNTVSLFAHMACLQNSGAVVRPVEIADDADVAAERNNLWIDDKICIDPNGNITNWFSAEDFAQWEFEVYHPGSYMVSIQTRAIKYTPWAGGHLVQIECGDSQITARLLDGEKVQNSHSHYFDERLTSLGTIKINEPGVKKLTLRLLELNKEERAGLLVTRILLKKL